MSVLNGLPAIVVSMVIWQYSSPHMKLHAFILQLKRWEEPGFFQLRSCTVLDNFYQVYQSVRVAKAKLLFYDFDETLLHPLIPYVNIATETAKARFMAKIIQMPSLKL